MTDIAEGRTTTDGSGQLVRVGATVRIVQIHDSTTTDLPELEKERVLSMLGDAFEVYEIDEWGQAWVEKNWHEGEELIDSHSLGLEPAQMVLIANNGA
jgi:hypothetical protein